MAERAPLISSVCRGGGITRVKSCIMLNLLLILTLCGVLVGFVVGLAVRTAQPGDVAKVLIAFPGEMLLRMLRMLVIPLIAFSLMGGLGALDMKTAGRLGWMTVLYYMVTTLLAVVEGLALVYAIRPGRDPIVEKYCTNASTQYAPSNLKTLDALLDLVRNVFPDNIFTAAFQQAETQYRTEYVVNFTSCAVGCNLTRPDNVTCAVFRTTLTSSNCSCLNSTIVQTRSLISKSGTNFLGIIVFAVGFAIALSHGGDQGRAVIAAIATMGAAIMKLITLIMWYSPIGIASIIAGKLIEIADLTVLVEQLGLYVACVLVGLLIHSCVVLPAIYLVLTRRNPLLLVRSVLQALLMAFGTASSAATLPVTMRNLENNFGVSSRVTSFILPLGTTVNMNGTALYEAVAAVFIAQLRQRAANFSDIIVIAITAIAASVGAAGVPSAGLFTLVIVLTAVGLPPEDVAIILTVDWFLDRFRTVVNVLGDIFGVGIVHHYSQRTLNQVTSEENTDREALISGEGEAPPPGSGDGEVSVGRDTHWSDSDRKGEVPTMDSTHLSVSDKQDVAVGGKEVSHL